MLKFKPLWDETLDSALEPQRETYMSQLEPFDAHANRIKAQYIAMCETYVQCLQNGYDLIIEKIKSDLK